jgi:hypothetical protein
VTTIIMVELIKRFFDIIRCYLDSCSETVGSLTLP